MPTKGGTSIEDPVVSTWFKIEFQGAVSGAFREVSGFGSETEIVESKFTTPDGKAGFKKIPGRTKFTDITLKRGITSALDMWKWRQQVEEGKIDDARKNGTITMFNSQGEAIAKWDLVNAWPSKLSGPTANATANEVGIEELVITHEGYKRAQ